MLRSGRLERLCAGGSFVESGVSLDDWGVVGHDLICVDILFGQRLDSEGIYCGFGKGSCTAPSTNAEGEGEGVSYLTTKVGEGCRRRSVGGIY